MLFAALGAAVALAACGGPRTSAQPTSPTPPPSEAEEQSEFCKDPPYPGGGNFGGGGNSSILAVLSIATSTALLLGSSSTGLTDLSSCHGDGRDDRDNSEAIRIFVDANREAVASDIARGRGETIQTISNLAGCADVARVGFVLQANFATIFPLHGRSAPGAQRPGGPGARTPAGPSVIAILRGDPSLSCSKI